MIDLPTIPSDAKICTEICGAKCCNSRKSLHDIMISPQDYQILKEYNLHQFLNYGVVSMNSPYPFTMNRTNGDCIFLDRQTKECLIYEIRPISCRYFPFLATNIDVSKFGCELYDQTDPDLRDEIKDKYDVKSLEREVISEASKYVMNNPSYISDLFDMRKQQLEINNPYVVAASDYSNFYFVLELVDEKYMPNAEQIVGKIYTNLKKGKMDWYYVQIMFFNDDVNNLRPLGFIRGHINNTDDANNLISDYDELVDLSKKFLSPEDHSIWKHNREGFVIPTKVYDDMKKICENI